MGDFFIIIIIVLKNTGANETLKIFSDYCNWCSETLVLYVNTGFWMTRSQSGL